MTDDYVAHQYVDDLGIAAYLLMHGFAVIGKKGKSIYFECQSKEEVKQFEEMILEYQPPNEFYTFDSCLMYLKKLRDSIPDVIDDRIHKVVTALGVAAYLLMHEYRPKKMGLKVIGKRGKNVYFKHPEDMGEQFKRLSYQYLPSQFHSYDSNLMSLKKIGEYMPTE
mgnify:CR=1 FL=1